MYYIISVKHTSIKDSALTMWRHDGAGYCWRKDWAGLYREEDAGKSDVLNIFVPRETADKLFKKTVYDQQVIEVIPNTEENREILGLNPKHFQPGKNRSCWMSF